MHLTRLLISKMKSSILLIMAIIAVKCNLILADTRMEFSTTPKVITEGITKSVKMTCSLNDKSKRAELSSEDVQTVIKMSIANAEGKTIAVIHGAQPHVLISKGGLTATGSLTGQAHLDLTFSNPDEMDTGVYKCSMIGLSSTHLTIDLENTWMVKTRDPKIDDVLGRIEALQKDNTRLNQEITKLNQCSVKVGFAVDSPLQAIVDTDKTVVYSQILLNQGGGYDNTTGVFTCRIPGLYMFTVHAQSTGTKQAYLGLVKNSKIVGRLYAHGYNYGDDYYNSASGSALVQMMAGDRLRVKSINESHFHKIGELNSFQGYLVQADGCQA